MTRASFGGTGQKLKNVWRGNGCRQITTLQIAHMGNFPEANDVAPISPGH